MEARSKTVEQWFSMIEQGQIVLPRFQRHEAWRHGQIVGLLENILRKPSLPIGTLLILEIGDEEPFHSRPIVGAPEPAGRPHMHLLDGQQRMTALWRALTGDYEDQDIVVSYGPPEESGDEEEVDPAPDLPVVERIKRWERKGVRQPVWADDPAQCFERELIPAALLRPGRAGEKQLEEWLDSVRAAGQEPGSKMGRIYELRQRVAGFMIPFLSLPVGTGRETALDVFIKMNTSASPLKDFDIVVAQLEEASGESLHDMVEELVDEVPASRDFGSVEDMILSVAALLNGKPPLKKTYLEKGFGGELNAVWPKVKHGFKRGISFLRSEAILNERIMPTDVAAYLTCALWANVPEQGCDNEGNARALIRKTLWRACFTDRYLRTSATRAFADYKVIREMLQSGDANDSCDLFNDEINPLPTVEELVTAGWPKRKDRLPRAILATCLRFGGHDFADGAPLSAENVQNREYHHVFPVSVLGTDRTDSYVNRALNCALISWKTNRKVAANTPREYIEERAAAAKLGESEVKKRLESHLVPWEELMAGDYEAFLTARGSLVVEQLKLLCEGRTP